MSDYKTFELGEVILQSGQRLPEARLAYQTYGQLTPQKDNVVLLPTFYTGTHQRNEGFFWAGSSIGPKQAFYCVD